MEKIQNETGYAEVETSLAPSLPPQENGCVKRKITTGDIVSFQGEEEWRVVSVKNSEVTMCKMKPDNVVFQIYEYTELQQMVLSGTAELKTAESNPVDEEKLSERERSIFRRNKQIADDFNSMFGDDYSAFVGPECMAFLSHEEKIRGISGRSIRRILTKYLQSGMSESALAPSRGAGRKPALYGKKTGRPSETFLPEEGHIVTDEDREKIAKAFRRYMASPHETYDHIYQWMKENWYTETVKRYDENGKFLHNEIIPLPQRMIPSLNQFMYEIRAHIRPSRKSLIVRKEGSRSYRNNHRPLVGTALDRITEVLGEVQIDIMEGDVIALDDEGRPCGRPDVYMIIDALTKMIISIVVGFDNNSIVGMTNCVLCLGRDKTALLRDAGITEEEERELIPDGLTLDDVWPTGYAPHLVCTDRGSDFISDAMIEICERLNIDCKTLPAAMGSLKPFVERNFGTLEQKLDIHFYKKGEIEKMYGTDPYKSAVIPLKTIRKICLLFLLYHNADIINGTDRPERMVRDNIPATPVTLWKYYSAENGYPALLPPFSELAWYVCRPVKAKVTREGISVSGRKYVDAKDGWLIEVMTGKRASRPTVTARIDPRDVSVIFYRSGDGTVHRAFMKSNEFKGWTVKRYEEWKKERDRQDRRNKSLKGERLSAFDRFASESVRKAEKETKALREMNDAAERKYGRHLNEVRANRKEAKYKDQYENRVDRLMRQTPDTLRQEVEDRHRDPLVMEIMGTDAAEREEAVTVAGTDSLLLNDDTMTEPAYPEEKNTHDTVPDETEGSEKTGFMETGYEETDFDGNIAVPDTKEDVSKTEKTRRMPEPPGPDASYEEQQAWVIAMMATAEEDD